MKDTVKPLGTLIDDLNKIREKRRVLAEQDKKLEDDYKDLEAQIDARMVSEGMEKATGKTATVSFSTVVVANIVDWDAVCKYTKRTGNFQLFQRRISDPAFRELLETKKAAIPGLEAFEKRKLNLRAL
ncbi:hypothetical protein [Uliginosibacterium gangwonense]|uniref:hypothetical protein n=1 Tax=Uliginosibacterium gangwonense TaxID=392736 RepID=UPI00037D524A|nr:hypothetical protein [Uliginosibacterium gangwonense]